VVKNQKVFQEEIRQDSNKQMVNLIKVIPGLDLDLKYATKNNFMHQKLYPFVHTTFLRKPAADSLKKIVEELKKKHLAVKIFDVLNNRNLLRKIMEKYGFIQLTTEWWHYYLPNSSSFELLDLSFSDLRKRLH
jgi:D-alanyl-D-alanine dipeptidase